MFITLRKIYFGKLQVKTVNNVNVWLDYHIISNFKL